MSEQKFTPGPTWTDDELTALVPTAALLLTEAAATRTSIEMRPSINPKEHGYD